MRSRLFLAYPSGHGNAPDLTTGLWDRTPPEAQAYIQALEARLAAFEELRTVQALQEQVRALEEQLNQTSRNSSRPPSSDPPQVCHVPNVARGVGAVVAVNRAIRAIPVRLIPVEEVDEVVPLKPERVAAARRPYAGDDPTPFRHQVIEIPPIQPVVTEYQWHQLVCPDCGETTRAPWPEGVPSGTYGPRVHATVALCTRVVSLVQAHDGAGDGRMYSVCR